MSEKIIFHNNLDCVVYMCLVSFAILFSPICDNEEGNTETSQVS